MAFPVAGATRAAELAARTRLGTRRSSIFLTPPRAVLECEEFADANALAKATQGDSYIDPTFDTNWSEARDHGLMFAGYVFASPDETDGATQARRWRLHFSIGQAF